MLYRSASPCDNKHCRASCTDGLIEQNDIRTILDLADSDEDIADFMRNDDFASPYFLSLYESGNVIPVNLHANFYSEDFRTSLAEGLRIMNQKGGPYLIPILCCIAGVESDTDLASADFQAAHSSP